MGEVFSPPKNGLAPSNYDPSKHDVYVGTKTMPTKPLWAWGFTYRLELKKVRSSEYFAYNEIGGVIFGCSLIQAWHWVWTEGRTTKFVIEHVLEDNIIIDIIVHKSP